MLIPVLVGAEVVLIWLWLRVGSRRRRNAVLAGLSLCVLLPVIQKLVVTQRERVGQVCHALVDAVRDGDIDELGMHIAESFNVRGIDRRQLLDAARSSLSQYRIDNITTKIRESTVTGSAASVRMSIQFRLTSPDDMMTYAVVAWQLEFEFKEGEWYLTAADPVPTASLQYDRLEQIVR